MDKVTQQNAALVEEAAAAAESHAGAGAGAGSHRGVRSASSRAGWAAAAPRAPQNVAELKAPEQANVERTGASPPTRPSGRANSECGRSRGRQRPRPAALCRKLVRRPFARSSGCSLGLSLVASTRSAASSSIQAPPDARERERRPSTSSRPPSASPRTSRAGSSPVKCARKQASTEALRAIKSLRYEGGEYFWINDLQPRMVMHPIKPELDGRTCRHARPRWQGALRGVRQRRAQGMAPAS